MYPSLCENAAKAVPSTPHSCLTNLCPTHCSHANTVLPRTQVTLVSSAPAHQEASQWTAPPTHLHILQALCGQHPPPTCTSGRPSVDSTPNTPAHRCGQLPPPTCTYGRPPADSSPHTPAHMAGPLRTAPPTHLHIWQALCGQHPRACCRAPGGQGKQKVYARTRELHVKAAKQAGCSGEAGRPGARQAGAGGPRGGACWEKEELLV